MKKIRTLLIALVIIFFLSLFVYFLYKYDLLSYFLKNIDLNAPYITNVKIKEYNQENKSYFIVINVKDNFNKQIYCYASTERKEKFKKPWQESIDGKCEFEIEQISYNIYIKDKNNNINKISDILKDKKQVFEIKLEDTTYLALNSTKKLTPKIISIGENLGDVIYSSSDETILDVTKDGVLKPKATGEVIVTASLMDKSTETKVIITNLITKAKINNYKKFLPCKKYNEKQANLLDKILEARVNEAGYQTRAGVVASARFLLLEFPYRISYFPENGRMTKKSKVDGEGRYYHKGLYLNKNKFSEIEYTFSGPVIWGCPLKVMLGEEDQPAGEYYENGLDCSGFVAWIMINGGIDTGDIGAGFSSVKNFSNIAKRKNITMSLLKSKVIKAGDLIGYDGHIGIIIGIDDKNVYIGDTIVYERGATVRKFSYASLVYSIFTYIVPMDDIYKEDGNYTNMW